MKLNDRFPVSLSAPALALSARMAASGGRGALIAGILLWIGVLVVGVARILDFSFQPGDDKPAPAQWPAQSAIRAVQGVQTLLLFVHPRCPCTRASAIELAQLLARSRAAVEVSIVVFEPQDAAQAWTDSATLREFRETPDVRIFHDQGGREARRFHAATSGRALLYDADGRLLFDGGITASRGHAGSNAGADSVAALLVGREPARSSTPVFGCPILTRSLPR